MDVYIIGGGEIAFTVIICILISVMLLCDLFVFTKRKQLLSFRKSSSFLIYSSFGNVSILISHILIVWYWPDPPIIHYILYYYGFSLFVIPIILRPWRIICIYSTTPNFPLQSEPQLQINFSLSRITTSQKRGRKWIYKRLVIALIPSVLITFVLLASLEDADLVWTIWDFIVLFGIILVTIRLFQIKKEITLKDLEESSLLIVFSIIVIFYFILDNIFWWGFLRSNPSLIEYHITGAIILQSLIFCSSVGYFIYLILFNKNNNNDIKVSNASSTTQAST